MAKLQFLITVVLVISIADSTTNDSEDGNKKESGVEIITVSKIEECEKWLEPTDIAIFYMDIVFKVGEREENRRSADEEKMPETVPLGKQRMLPVLEESVIGMCVGEHRKIIVPPHLGVGNRTVTFKDGRTLEGGATIITDIKLLQIIRNNEEEHRKLFEVMDSDGDGKLDQEEIQAIVDISVQSLKDISDESKEEFKDMMKKVITAADEDKDGNINFKELRNVDNELIKSESAKLFSSKLYDQLLRNVQLSMESCPTCPEPEECPGIPVGCTQVPSPSVFKPEIKRPGKTGENVKSDIENLDTENEEEGKEKDELKKDEL